ncbi:MAG: class I SAM-dependent methyltransferase [Planctomycetota bacterium]|jgi:SAM-dependent methyltransferase
MTAIDPDEVHRYELDTWSRCAEEYLDGFSGLTLPGVPLLVEAARLGQGDRVLEIGCGPGHVSAALAGTGVHVTGIDFSGAMIAVARRRYPELAFQEANAEQLPFEDESFDAVVSSFVVHHLARPEAVFREVRRVLRPGRRFAFAVFAAPEAQSSIGAFFAAVEAHHSLDELPHGPLFGVTDLSVYESMLDAAGLTDFAFEMRPVTWSSRTVEPVLRSFWNWGNMSALPQDVQDRIEATTRENLKSYEKDGTYALPHEALIGSAARA